MPNPPEDNHVFDPPERASLAQRLTGRLRANLTRFKAWFDSPPIRGTLKCSIAYTIASMATYVTPLSEFLGNPGGKHVVATITVYFHASRSMGSMIEAVMIAVVAILYAELVSVLSMATSVLFGAVLGQVAIAHTLVCIVFIGGGFGFMAWVKQVMGNPLVNVASTLASLAIISVVTKETHVIYNVFSNEKIVQVLKILVMGVISSTAVNLLLWPVSARKMLQQSLNKAFDCLADEFTIIETGVLEGSEDEITARKFAASAKSFSSAFGQVKKNRRESQFEHYFVGHERRCQLEKKLVESLSKLSQSIGGLRSASGTLFLVLKESTPARNIPSAVRVSEETINMPLTKKHTPRDIFERFASRINQTMSALSIHIIEVLKLGDNRLHIDDRLSIDLSNSLKAFSVARQEALEDLYDNAVLLDSKKGQAELEQISAACGHFSFSLQLFADEIQNYLEILEDLQLLNHGERRTWKWMLFWRGNPKRPVTPTPSQEEEVLIRQNLIRQSSWQRTRPSTPAAPPQPTNLAVGQDTSAMGLTSRIAQTILRNLGKMLRDDIVFGVKVGIGASLWAALAFAEETRDWYNHYRGEWGLLSFMIVCSMTVGASNTTGWSRFLGTLLGAFFSLLNWNLGHGNPIILATLGWATSFFCFHLLVAQGKAPLGRMTLLAYNVSTLYAYSMSQKQDNGDGDDEGGADPNMWEIAKHRVIAVTAGILWGLIICRVIWPISAREKFQKGFSSLCLQMGLIWKRGPLAILLRSDCTRSYIKTGEQEAMQKQATRLEGLRQSAAFELELHGPFPFETSGQLMSIINRILNGFFAMSLITAKKGSLTEGERALLQHTAKERAILCDRICHIFHVIASSMMLEFPLTTAVPNIQALRDALLAKVFEFRKLHDEQTVQVGEGSTSAMMIGGNALAAKIEESDYALLYAYVLVTGQVAKELGLMEKEVQKLFGAMTEEDLIQT